MSAPHEPGDRERTRGAPPKSSKRARRKPNGHIPHAPLWDHDDDRPLVAVELGELSVAVARCNELLAERSGAMFVLGDILVTIEDVDDRLQTVPVTQARISLELGRVARFERTTMTKDGPEQRACDPPLKLAAAIESEPGGWRSPALAGLTAAPILRPDGGVVTTPGYDPMSRLYLHGGPFDPIGDDVAAALVLLKDALREFVFVAPHHRSGALALLLTAACRRVLPSSPLFGISAHEAGSGKGTLAQLAAIVATGARAAERPWPAGNPEEERKAITSTLLGGRPILLLDNIDKPLDSSALCVLLTSEMWSDRRLGVLCELFLPCSLLPMATGNNLQIVGDLCRRVLPIEMDAECESPELRRFERELMPWAIENRPALLAAALTILSCYRRAGSPLPESFAPLGSFEEWSRTVCGALVWLGEPDPRDAMADTRANDPKRIMLGSVLAGMAELFGKSWQTAGTLYASAGPSAERVPGLVDALDEITAKARDDAAKKIALGKWLLSQHGKIAGKLRLDVSRDTDRKVNLWRATPI